MLGCVSEVRQSLLESCEVLANLFDGGSTVSDHSGHEFDRVVVPVVCQARLLEHVEIGDMERAQNIVPVRDLGWTVFVLSPCMVLVWSSSQKGQKGTNQQST